MITYFYWTTVVLLAVLVLAGVGWKLEQWKAAIALGLTVVLVGWASYFFHFQQMFVKRWGGVMTIEVPKGQLHLAATWKDDNLWVENYDPATDTCHFNEYSKGNLLQGKVTIKNCNPLLRMQPGR